MDVPEPSPSPLELVDDLDRIEEALALAVADALRMHKRAGNPICVGRDGKVEWIQPEDIVVPGDE